MTEAKELDPAALEVAWQAGEIALKDHVGNDMGSIQRTALMQVVTEAVIPAYLEALSTAPVALEAGWNTDLDAMPHALTLLFKAHDPDEPEGVVSLGIRGEEPQRLIAWSFLPSAIHPAPSRAVIDREQAANLAYRLCAETRHVTLGDSIAAALRSLPSNAPSLGEARLAEGEARPAFWHNGMGQMITAAMKASFAPDDRLASRFDQPLYAHPSHVQAEAGE